MKRNLLTREQADMLDAITDDEAADLGVVPARPTPQDADQWPEDGHDAR